MLSQEEIDALLNGGDSSDSDEQSLDMSLLTAEEKDTLGEVGNISMGTAATTLFTLLSHKVTITTPRVSETTLHELVKQFESPLVTINVHYTAGIEGVNLLLIEDKDVKVITDLMMGGDGTNVADELTELHLSAISEAMNQMIGSSSTSLSEMLGQKIDISPPEAFYEDVDDIDKERLGVDLDETVVLIAFDMKIGELIDSQIMQLMPLTVAKQIVAHLTPQDQGETIVSDQLPQATPTAPTQSTETPAPSAPAPAAVAAAQMPSYQAPMQQQARPPVNAQSIEFQSFDGSQAGQGIHGDIGLIRDVPLEITVELGRTNRKISEILDFSAGSVIELNKIVGESLDILANGKIIARGEVVVVDENYGVRITEIIVPQHKWSTN